MAVNRRGVVLLLLTTTGFGASLALIWPRRSRPPKAQPVAADASARDASGDAKIRLGSKEHYALCSALASRYDAMIETASMGCTRDEDCIAQERGGIYLGLDGCGRFGTKTAAYANADQVAAQWLASACSFAPDVTADCGGVYAKCLRGRCIERAPAPLPGDWKRLSLRGTISVFAPPDFEETDVRGEDSLVRVFDGKDRSLALSLDPYGDGQVEASLHPRADVLDGERAQVYFVDHGADAGALRYEASAVFERHWSEFFLAGGYLSMHLYCATASACADRDAIFRSTRVLIQPFEVRRDR